MRIAVLGPSGMLGSQLLMTETEHEIVPIYRNAYDTASTVTLARTIDEANVDAVINCCVVLPLSSSKPIDMVRINALLPHMLAQAVGGRRLVLISTDRVFNGLAKSRYTISHSPDARDLYGKTKCVGEALGNNTCVVRTAFVGTKYGFMRWVINNQGGTIRAWSNSLWSGSTIDAVVQKLIDLATGDLKDVRGLQHLSSIDSLSRYELAQKLAQAFGLKVSIEAEEQPYINYSLVPTITLPSIDEAIADYAKWIEARGDTTDLQPIALRQQDNRQLVSKLASTNGSGSYLPHS